MFEPSGTSTTGDRHEGPIPAHVDSTTGHELDQHGPRPGEGLPGPQIWPAGAYHECGGRCNTAWMAGLSIALVNLKPGTGKTTSAVWLAHVFAEAGNTVLLVDADPSGSALEWSDLAAMYPGLPPQAAFPFRIVALPSRDLHRRVRAHRRPACMRSPRPRCCCLCRP
jgi:hypothetical protein